MEILKEMHVSTAQMECYMTEKNNFHLNLNGFLDDITKTNNPMFLSVKNVDMPPNVRQIEFSLYYGLSLKTGYSLRSFSTKYQSLEELATFVSQCGNMCLPPKLKCRISDGDDHDTHTCDLQSTCGNSDSDHAMHVCDSIRARSLLKLTYEHGRFYLENGRGSNDERYMTAMSIDLANVLGFKDVIERQVSSADCSGDCKTSIRFDGYAFLGKRCNMIRNEDKLCMFEFDDLIDCKIVSGNRYGRILFSFDMENAEIIKELGLKRLSKGGISYLKFRLLNRNFEPFDFCCDLRKHPISFVIQFVIKL